MGAGRIGRLLYNTRKELIIRTDRKGTVAGNVWPGYARFRGQLTIPEYVNKVVAGALFNYKSKPTYE